MATLAIPVHGGAVKWSTDGTTYTAIPEAKTLVVPDVSPDYIDVTSLDSEGYREYITGLIDPGEITLQANYIGTTYATAQGYATNGTLLYFQTELAKAAGQSSSGDSFVMRGTVVPSIPEGQAGDAVLMDLKIRLSGKPEFTAGS